MAQHDYVIDNQTAPNFRSDLNNALAAIVSNNSGAFAPSPLYANMIWYDTTLKRLRMRSEANDAWIDLGTLDQVAKTFAPAGLTNLTQVQAENPNSTVFGQVSGQRLRQAILTVAPPAPTAGNNIIFRLQDTAVQSGDQQNYPPVFHNRFNFANNLGVTVLIGGTIRVYFEHRYVESNQFARTRVLKNGSQIQEFQATSTSFQTVTLDVSVDVGDMIMLQHRQFTTQGTSEWRNLRILSGTITPAVA